jgi:hypothetical protein
MGHQRTSARSTETSAFPSGTDIISQARHVRLVPTPEVIASPDYFVRSGKYRGRNADAECFGCLQVDHELECGRLLDRQIGGYGPAENFVDVDRSRSPCDLSVR